MADHTCNECVEPLTRAYPRKQIWVCRNGHTWHIRLRRNRRTQKELNKRHTCVWCSKKRLEKFMQYEKHYHVYMWVCVRCRRQIKVLKQGKK